MIYGNLPKDLGLIDLSPVEMMFWMYCPISMPGNISFVLPDNLRSFIPIIRAARWDNPLRFANEYVYLTAKTLWVSGDYIGNRPGWHCDGFGTDDINYVWCDRAPTEFCAGSFRLSEDCAASMVEMLRYGGEAEALGTIQTFPDKHLLRLDQSVIHRSPVRFEPGMRTFVKVSISKNRYDLEGNSINHGLVESRWPLVARKLERNHPHSGGAA